MSPEEVQAKLESFRSSRCQGQTLPDWKPLQMQPKGCSTVIDVAPTFTPGAFWLFSNFNLWDVMGELGQRHALAQSHWSRWQGSHDSHTLACTAALCADEVATCFEPITTGAALPCDLELSVWLHRMSEQGQYQNLVAMIVGLECELNYFLNLSQFRDGLERLAR